MRFYKILKAKQCGNAEGLTAYERQFVEYLKKIDIKTITGVLPLTFTAKGGTAVDWVIEGNDENGTENFFGDYETFPSTHIANVNAWTSYDGGGLCQRVKCEGNTEYTLSFANTSSLFRISASSTNDVPTANNPVIVQQLVNTTNSNSETFTTPNNAKFIIVQISYDEQELLNSAMLVQGSTPPDHYIPYQQGVGERTENLLDAQAYEVGKAWNTSSNADRATVTLTVKPNTTYTVKVFETVADLVYVGVKESADATTAVASQQTVNGTVTITTTASAYTLAIQLNKTAITLNDCQNCKITLTEGSTAPAEYIPYGYQIPLMVESGETENWFDMDDYFANAYVKSNVIFTKSGNDLKITATDTNDPYVNSSVANGGILNIQFRNGLMPVQAGDTLTFSCTTSAPIYHFISFVDSNYVGVAGFIKSNESTNTFTIPQNCKYILIRFANAQMIANQEYTISNIMLVKGSTAPDHYIPHRYTSDYTFYIGSTPLTTGQSISKTSTGVDIELFEGENTVSTTLYNKPTMEIKYK